MLVGWRRAERPYADGDILWGVRTGQDFLHSGQLSHQDPYSWTAHGAGWVQNSWAWNVLLGATYRLGGFVGIALLGIALTGLIGVLAGTLARRAGVMPSTFGLIFLIVGGFFALFWYARPQLADYVSLLVLLLVLPTVFEGTRERAVRAGVGVAVLQAVWMNLHSTALIGPVLVLAAGLGRLRMDGSSARVVAVRTAALTGLTALACLATPYGLAPITHAEEVRRSSVGLIVEWSPAGFGSPEQWLGTIAIALGAVAGVLCWRAGRFDAVAVLVVLGVATGMAIRFAPLLVLAAVPDLAAGCSRLPIRPVLWRRGWLFTATVIGLLCLLGMGMFGRPGLPNDSPVLIRALPAHCRLLNDPDVGGAVMLRRPDVPVAIDSRNDMYGRTRSLELVRALADPRYGRRYVDEHGVTCVLAPLASPTAKALALNGGWRVAGDDGYRVLLLPSR
jgi:hypothetical protein